MPICLKGKKHSERRNTISVDMYNTQLLKGAIGQNIYFIKLNYEIGRSTEHFCS